MTNMYRNEKRGKKIRQITHENTIFLLILLRFQFHYVFQQYFYMLAK